MAEIKALTFADYYELVAGLHELLTLKRNDPKRGKSSSGKWTHINVRTEAIERLDYVLAKHVKAPT